MRHSLTVSALALLLVLGAACRGEPPGDAVGGADDAAGAPAAAEPSPEPTPDADLFEQVAYDDFDPANFDRSAAVVDNEWDPLVPGTRFVYEGRAIDEGDPVRRHIELTVTDLTKVVAGVRARVLWILDFNGDEVVEAELAFRAQDRDGNVWHLGEFPQEYEDGRPAAAPAWIHGIAGAKAGISMMAEPQLNGVPYRQGFAPPPIEWDDHGRVYQTGESTCVPVACYENVLVTEEFEPASPGAFQLKYYAPGVGNVRVGWRGLQEEERETLELVGYEKLGEAALAVVRADALALEARAYEVSKEVYGRTSPSRA